MRPHEEEKEEKRAVTAILVFLIAVLIVIMFASKFGELAKPRTFPEQTQEYCESKKARYIGFTNGCRDDCTAQRQAVSCTQALTTGCDCGPSECWNGFECEPN